MSEPVDWEQKAVNALDAIAEKLGTGVDHFWPLFVKEQIIDGVGLIVVGLVTFAFFIVIAYSGWKAYKKSMKEYSDSELAILESCFYQMGALIALIVSTTLFSIGARYILNPEYHALKAVMEMMK